MSTQGNVEVDIKMKIGENIENCLCKMEKTAVVFLCRSSSPWKVGM